MSNSATPARKSLFSLSVDDIIIQRIFKTMEEEIKKLTLEIQELKNDMPRYALKNDLDSLTESFTNYTITTDKSILATNEKIDNSIQDTNHRFEKMQKFVEGEIADAIFSVNNVTRAQNALIEEKIFQLTQPNIEYEELRRDVSKIKDKYKNIQEETNKLNTFLSSFFGDENGKPITLDQFVDRYLQDVRNKITELETQQFQAESKLERADFLFKKLLGNDEDFHYPTYKKVEKIYFSNKPKLPVLKDPCTIMDYFQYLMLFAPTVQKILSSFYHQICSLSNSIYDREEKEVSLEHLKDKIALLDQIESDVHNLKTNTIDPNKLQLFSEMVEELKKRKMNSDEIDDIHQQLLQIQNEFIQKDELDQAISEVSQNMDIVVSNAITELKESYPFFSEDFSGFNTSRSKADENSYPAIAAVTPRGTVSHKMMYKQNPSSTRVLIPKKEEIEEVGKYPRRTQRTASRVNIQLDSMPQASSSRSALATKKKFDVF